MHTPDNLAVSNQIESLEHQNNIPTDANHAPRFTLDGSDALEKSLNEICQRVLAGVLGLVPEKKLQAILLGGSYGRGEGGVWRTTSGDQPYHDLEFYVFLRGNTWVNEQKFEDALFSLAEKLKPTAKLDIKFKVLSLSRFRRSTTSMSSYDLACGHRWLWGAENLLKGCDHHRQSFRIPKAEATRLLMNRCSGLLLMQPYLEHEMATDGYTDTIKRSLAKLKMALGDAVLTINGQYYWICLERNERLLRLAPSAEMPWLAEVQRCHSEGIAFKLHPAPANDSWEELRAEYLKLSALSLRVWLWLENRRLNQQYANVREYAFSPVNKCPESRGVRNRMMNMVTFGIEAFWEAKSAHSPRERLLNSLPLLLWENASLREPMFLKKIQAELATFSSTVAGLLKAYEKLWTQYQ